MEQILKPLKDRLTKERLIEADWPTIVTTLEAIRTKENFTEADCIVKVYGQPMSPALIDELVTSETRRAKIKEVARGLKLDRHIIEFLKGNLFFAEVSRWIKKVKADSWQGIPVPTAAMCFNIEKDDFTLVWNAEFMASFIVDHGEIEGSKIIQFIYGHELYHFTLKHLTFRRQMPAFAWNIATDAANNSLLVHAHLTMPPCGIYPSKRWDPPPFRLELRKGKVQREMTPAEKAMREGLSTLIESWKPMLTSEWYMADLMKWAKESGNKFGKRGMLVPGGDGDGESDLFDQMDDHDLWDKIPNEARERITDRMRKVMKDAAKRADADGNGNGWGTIPSDIQKAIRSFIDNRVDWETVLRNYAATFNKGSRVKSLKRVNKKYPMIHAGHRRDYAPKLLILLDESGSMRDEWVALIFAVLGSLTRKISITVAPFDTDVAEGEVFEWKKGQACPKLKRVKQGGTSFKAACDWANDPKNRGRWDGCLIASDGESFDPGPSKLRRAYIIVPGRKLLFPTKELVIQMEEEGATKRDGTLR
jgi:predicted metal-dependent peptidase